MAERHPCAYLHGFASGPESWKGRQLDARFRQHGPALQRPDLNRPSFAELTLGGALGAVDELDRAEGGPEAPAWCFVGSSMGGWVAARWAELNPERVHRLVLLCPGFDLVSRWPSIVGEQALARWQREGFLELPDREGQPVPVHWEFVADARRRRRWPEVPCPTLIVHGVHDEQVPVDFSRSYAAGRPHVELVEVDDDHGLAASVDRIAELALAHFGLADAARS